MILGDTSVKIPAEMGHKLLTALRVKDIRFSKCSGGVVGAGRNRHISGIHAADMPFSNVLLENCCLWTEH